MKFFKYALFALLGYSFFLVALLPARFVMSKVPSQPGLTFGAAHGTIWQGKLDFVRYNNVRVNDVSWDFNWSSLLQGQVMLDTTMGRHQGDIRGGGAIGYSMAGVVVNQFKLSAPLSIISQIKPLPLGLQASGDFNLTLDSYQQAAPWCETLAGNIRLSAANIKSNFGSVDIKKAQAVVRCDKGALVAVIKPATNSLGINATVRLDSKQLLEVSGHVKPPGNAPRDFVELLKFTGKADANGRYLLNFKQAI
ncbi:MAG: type II secretion system protein N [Gammaproteobacteria bacterium]|nr:type II secretion system protein N [Gammaproteobacteria bacterium]